MFGTILAYKRHTVHKNTTLPHDKDSTKFSGYLPQESKVELSHLNSTLSPKTAAQLSSSLDSFKTTKKPTIQRTPDLRHMTLGLLLNSRCAYPKPTHTTHRP